MKTQFNIMMDLPHANIASKVLIRKEELLPMSPYSLMNVEIKDINCRRGWG